MSLKPARARSRLLAHLALIGLAVAPEARAEHPCAPIALAGAPQLALSDDYNPFAGSDLRETTALQIVNNGEALCDLAVVFVSPNSSKLRNGNETLTYTIASVDGAPLLNAPNLIDPLSANHIRLTLGGGEAASFSVNARVHAGQDARPGGYTDTTLSLRVYALSEDASSRIVDEHDVPVSAQVAPVCTMSAPEPDVLDFSTDIAPDGRPSGQWRGLQLPEAACNTSARLKLTARALANARSEIAAGFDGFIDFEAQAVLNSGAAILLTDGVASPEQVSSSKVQLDPSETHPISLQIRLRAGRPLAAGDYESVLTISLEPSS